MKLDIAVFAIIITHSIYDSLSLIIIAPSRHFQLSDSYDLLQMKLILIECDCPPALCIGEIYIILLSDRSLQAIFV
jgi:hypothetical protein